MKILTINGIIDTKDVEFIGIEKKGGIMPEYWVAACIDGQFFEFDNTRTIDEIKVVRKFEAIANIIKQNHPKDFVCIGVHLVNVDKASYFIEELKNGKVKIKVKLSNGISLRKKFKSTEMPEKLNEILNEDKER